MVLTKNGFHKIFRFFCSFFRFFFVRFRFRFVFPVFFDSKWSETVRKRSETVRKRSETVRKRSETVRKSVKTIEFFDYLTFTRGYRSPLNKKSFEKEIK